MSQVAEVTAQGISAGTFLTSCQDPPIEIAEISARSHDHRHPIANAKKYLKCLFRRLLDPLYHCYD